MGGVPWGRGEGFGGVGVACGGGGFFWRVELYCGGLLAGFVVGCYRVPGALSVVVWWVVVIESVGQCLQPCFAASVPAALCSLLPSCEFKAIACCGCKLYIYIVLDNWSPVARLGGGSLTAV